MLTLLNFHTKNTNFVDQLVNESCQFKKWQTLKDEYHLDNDMYFQWTELIHAKLNKIKQDLSKNESNLLVLNHYLIKNARTLTFIRQSYGEENIFNLGFISQK